MNKIGRLIKSYGRYIAIPWRDDASAMQRVIFCVYDEGDELRLRARIVEFEIATREAAHDWTLFDLTNTFADWLSAQRYANSYFDKPQLLGNLLPKFLDYIETQFRGCLTNGKGDSNTVVALKGVGSLFGFLKVKEVVDRLAPLVSGRLLVFFPGTYENNNYRLLDGYDGWNYLAIPITADKDF